MPPVQQVERRQAPDVTARTIDASLYAEAYQHSINLSQLLEQLDPSTAYPVEPGLGRRTTALERALQAAQIRTAADWSAGLPPMTYEEAMRTPQSRALVMEWAADVWRRTTRLPLEEKNALLPPEERAVLLAGDAAINTLINAYTDDRTIRAKRLVPPIPLEAIIARRTPIRGDGFRSLYIVDDLNTDAYRMKRVTEGTEIPFTTLVSGEHTLRIHKYGRALRSTYEQLRRLTLDRIAFIIQRMALQAEVDKAVDAMNTIISGDGNSNTAATVLALTALDAAASAGTLTLKGFLAFKLRFTNAYQADTLLAQEASILQLFMLPVNTVNGTPLAMMPPGAVGTLRPISPQLNGSIAYGITADAPSLKLVAFDSSQAVEMLEEIGGDVSEVERVITNQTQVFTLTEVVGFGVIDPNASKVLNINA